MVDIQSTTAEIRRRIKKIERNYRMKILWSALLHRATIKIRMEAFSFNELEYGFFGSYSPNFTKNRVGCPMEGTFGIIERAFEVFGRNKMYAKVSNFIYPQQYGSCHTS